jgi:fucokinase
VKDFLSMPYLAGDNPDGPAMLLFDNIMGILVSTMKEIKDQGCRLQVKP